jgi:preprotein translocase subunit SecE
MARVSTRSTRPISPEALGRVNPVAFFRETVSELRKSVWPSREETVRLTAVVIALSVAAGFFLGGLDRLLVETFGRFVLRL